MLERCNNIWFNTQKRNTRDAKQVHSLQMRVKELAEENYELKKLVMPDLSDKIPEAMKVDADLHDTK